MKFLGKMCLKIILKVTKNQGLTLSLEDTFSEKPQGSRVKLTPHTSRSSVKALENSLSNNQDRWKF